MFNGYLSLSGNEIINVARTQAYLDSGYAPPGVNATACEDCEFLPEMLGDKPYVSPLLDQDCPWFESGNPDTWDFAGIIPIEITGTSGSTRSASTNELTVDGGVAYRPRYAGRTISVTALLMGKSGCAVEAGLTWLSTVLAGSNCSGPRTNSIAGNCTGDELCMFTCCPTALDEVAIPNQYVTEPIFILDPGWKGISGTWQASRSRFVPIEVPTAPVTNYVINPSFEVDTSTWRVTGATLSRTEDQWGSKIGNWSGLLTAGSATAETVTVQANSSAGTTVALSAQGSQQATNPAVEQVTPTATANGTTVSLAATGAQVSGPGSAVVVGPSTLYPVQGGQIVDWMASFGTTDTPLAVQSKITYLTESGVEGGSQVGATTEVRAESYTTSRVSGVVPPAGVVDRTNLLKDPSAETAALPSWTANAAALKQLVTTAWAGKVGSNSLLLTANPTNLVTNGTFETDTSGWAASGPTVVVTNDHQNPSVEGGSINGYVALSTNSYPVTVDATSQMSGVYSIVSTRIGTLTKTCGACVLNQPSGVNGNFLVTAGVPVTASLDVKAELAGRKIRAFIQWLDAANAATSGTTVDYVASTVAGQTYRIAHTDTPPAGTVGARLRLFLETADNSNAVLSERVWFDNATWGSAARIDGSLAASGTYTYAWTGTANASTSTRTSKAVVSRSTSRFHTGVASLQFTFPTGNAGANTVGPTISGLTIGNSYTVEAWLYVPAASISAQPALGVVGIASPAPTPITTPDQWVRSTYTFTATATSHTLAAPTTLAATTEAMLVYVDDVKMYDAAVGPYVYPQGAGTGNRIPAAPGDIVYGQVNVGATTAANRVRVGIAFYNSAGTQVGSTLSGYQALAAGQNATMTHQATAPAATATALFIVYLYGATTGVDPTAPLLIDAATVQINQPISAYFDGSTPAAAPYTYRWTGTPNASPSERLTPVTQARIDVTVTQIATDGGGGLLAGTRSYIDAAALYLGQKQSGQTYFDGDRRDTQVYDFAWTGTPGLSTSTATPVAMQPELDAPVQECADEATFIWNVSTESGPVSLIPAAKDPETGAFLAYGQSITFQGNSAVPFDADPGWGNWIPVLLVDTTPGALPFTVAPDLRRTRYKTAEECSAEYLRSYLNTTTIAGPTVTDRIEFLCGEYALQVEWTMFVGNPFIYGPEIPLAGNVRASDGHPGYISNTDRGFLAFGVSSNGYGLITDKACPAVEPVWKQVVDPCCPGFITSPTPPQIDDTCWDHPTTYIRAAIEVSKDYAPSSGDGTFIIDVQNDGKAKRGVRIRIYPDPVENGYTGIAPCDFCDEFYITYIPARARLRIDGVNRQITTRVSGGQIDVPTSASVRGANGGPFTFPTLTCNVGYVIVIDCPDVYPETCGNDKKGADQGDLWVDLTLRTMAF